MFNSPEFDDHDGLPKDRSSTPVSHLKEMLGDRQQMKIQVKSLDKLKSFRNFENDIEEETHPETRPIDLSMDVLDLSKKTNNYSVGADEEDDDLESDLDDDQPDQEQDAEIPKFDLFDKNAHLMFMQQQLLNESMPKLDPAQFYQLAQMYRTFGFPTPGFPLHPALLMQNPLLASSALNDMKNFFQKDMMPSTPQPPQMSGGSLIVNPFVSPDSSPTGPPSVKTSLQQSPVSSNQIQNQPFPLTPQESPKKTATPIQQAPLTTQHQNINHSGPVKMVIKNGVLMPKQKQRRYRTERPFACEHCSARFTLRSNMERHIKQQHPQFWAQRQRGSHNLMRRTPSVPSINQPMMPSNMQGMQNSFGGISDQVKYAILAQQLKARESPKNNLMTQQFQMSLPQNFEPQIQMHIKEEPNTEMSPKTSTPMPDDDEPKLVIDEEYQAEDLSKSSDSTPAPNVCQNNLAARKIAENILEQAIKMSYETQTKNSSFNGEKDFEAKRIHHDSEVRDSLPFVQTMKEEGNDLVSVSRLVDNATNAMMFSNYFRLVKLFCQLEHNNSHNY